ncbi:MAG: type II toxin-antitoxin system RelE/ParE family toxin [Proteobacteria bacterium]|nr:type II toxin-antitoxin system RelE/ParE family toxin [Pseudomonadota bacterium]
MGFKIIWSQAALDNLKKIEKPYRQKIYDRIGEYLARDPMNIGKPLTGNLAGIYRYRYGDYRVLYVLDLTTKTIKILEAGHRREIYDK